MALFHSMSHLPNISNGKAHAFDNQKYNGIPQLKEKQRKTKRTRSCSINWPFAGVIKGAQCRGIQVWLNRNESNSP
uniref:Candidate secreted effector n=1 Tax=Meloidogyne incognita TaxID=6306 RepID=A0A914MTZ3_MELIC